jgi:hypothetical protein
MLMLWRAVPLRKYLRIFVRDWKPRDWICWLCFER